MLPQTENEVRGRLYIVATPIGNLEDISARALRTLAEVDVIGAEDTRHTRKLLTHFGIDKPLFALHDHNEKDKIGDIAKSLDAGKNMALVSDAGTPLICDPGYAVVSELRQLGYDVTPIPGPSAVITALCAAGLPTDRFTFIGFLPAKAMAKQGVVEQWSPQMGTIVFYESTHRILDTLEVLSEVLPNDAKVVLARELTKTFETFLSGSASDVLGYCQMDSNQTRGEFVVMISLPQAEVTDAEAERVLRILMKSMPTKQAAATAAELLGDKKNRLYKLALTLAE